MSTAVAVSLEPLAAVDFDLAARWLATPAINRWLTSEWRERQASPTTLAIATRNRRNRLFLVRHQTVPCGLVGLSELDASDRTANLWYLLGDPTLAGQGVTSAAVRELITISFGELGLVSLQAWAMRPNVPSLRLLEKVGFRAAGCFRQSTTLDGTPTDRLLFDLLASERSPS